MTIQCRIQGQTFDLYPDKALFWREENMLIVSDVHLGKAMHFRKAGIPVPLTVIQKNFTRLTRLVKMAQPCSLFILGDFFHSYLNQEWELFLDWRSKYPDLEIELLKGNHDILPESIYRDAGVIIHEETLMRGPFLFSHEPLEVIEDETYVLSGHVHPAVRLRGAGQQSLTLPCFYFGDKQGLLPAFGEFTGFHVLYPQKKDQIFVVAADEVVAL